MAMDNLLTNAARVREQAERLHALAVKEGNRKRQQVMFAIAEHYYLLHDRLLELGQMEPGENVVTFAAAKP
jgi:hypothetical protein